MRQAIVVGVLMFGSLASQPSLALPPEETCNHGCPCSPLLVDVKGNGIKLGPAGVGVYFDLFAVGAPIHLQWTRAGGDDAFVVVDLNGNGIVDDGSELFGQGTTLVLTGERARNGFVALQQYDAAALGGNEDGLITSADSIWTMLRLWTDRNADGKTQRGELRSPSSLGFTSFEILPKFKPYYDEAGNYIPVYAWATRLPGRQVMLVDVFFNGLSD